MLQIGNILGHISDDVVITEKAETWPIGKFYLRYDPCGMRKDWQKFKRLFSGMVVLHAEYCMDQDAIEYITVGDMFDQNPHGQLAPVYRVTMTDSGRFEFEREHGA